MIYGMNSGKVAFIVTKNGKRICDVIDECSQRGSTILKAQGGYKQDDIQVVMCACNSKEMYQVRKSVKIQTRTLLLWLLSLMRCTERALK